VADHQHPDATNFAFVRGVDALTRRPQPVRNRSSLTSNALTLDTDVVTGDYAQPDTVEQG
jgi:hypothetical protein